jgi:uncharacterized protein (DUF2267 family)
MGIHHFDKHAQVGNELLGHLASEIGEPDNLKKADRMLKAVLHTLRDSIPMEESFQFMAQLPLIVKGIYVSDWKYSTQPKKIRHLDAFIEEVKIKDNMTGEGDFKNSDKASLLIKKVFKVLGQYASRGEWKDILANLPRDIRPLLEPALERAAK